MEVPPQPFKCHSFHGFLKTINMYKISQYSNKIKNTITNEVFLQDDREALYPAYLEWLQNDGSPEFVDYFDDEINQIKTSIYMQRLQNVVTDLRIKAKGAAIGKTGTNSYIIAQEEFYEIKYQQCINPNNSQEGEDLLANEAAEFGITLEQFKTLVISMYEQAKEKYNLFMRMIERFRTKIQTLIENNNWQSADSAFNIVETLDNVDEAQSIMTEILNL